VPLPSQPSRSKAYTPLFLFSRGLGNTSRWITCLVLCPPRTKMIVYLWWLIGFRRWPLSQPARRASQQSIFPRYSLNRCGSILVYHKPSPHIGTTVSSTYFRRVSSHSWTQSSLNPLLSTFKPMARQRSSIGLLCTFCACTTLNIHVHAMRFFPMFNIATTRLSIAPLAISHFRWG
jgi:hypothetical protein